MYLNHFENTMNFLNHYVLTSHKYVVRVVAFFQCLFLIELNAWEDAWFVIVLQLLPKKRREKWKKEEEKEMI